MELDQLRHLVHVADTGSITKAAEVSFLSQPALSRSIQRLEESLGVPLLERQARSVCLTQAGTVLVERARNILSMVDDLKKELHDDDQTGTLRLGAIPTIAPYFLPELLKGFQRDYPNARVQVIEETTDLLLKQLADGIIDIAIAALPIHAKHLKVQTLFEEELLLVMSTNHPLAQKKSIHSNDIVHESFVLLGEAHCLSDSILSYCKQRQFQPISVERTCQLATVQELVALQHGISFVPEMARQCDSSRRRIYRSISGSSAKRTIAMVTNPYRYDSKLHKAFRAFVRQVTDPTKN